MNENPSSSDEIGCILQLNMPPNQCSVSRFSKGKPPAHRSVRRSKSRDKEKPDNAVGPQNADHQKDTKSVGGEEEELVRYMSEVPGFLQRGEQVQDNVLNFGVLDWGSLEKWTQRKNKDSLSERSYKPSNEGCSASMKSEGLTCEKKKPTSSEVNLSHKFDCSPVIEPLCDRMDVNHLNMESSLYLSLEVKKIQTKEKPQPNDAELKSVKGKEKEKSLDTGISLVKGTNSSKLIKQGHRSSDTAKIKIISHDEPEKCAENLPKHGLDTSEQHHSGKQESIFLILPKDFSRPGSSEAHSRVSLDGKLADFSWGSFSDIFSVDEIQSDRSLSDVAHSCPLPHAVETEKELDSKLEELIKEQDAELLINPPHFPLHPNEKSMRAGTSRSAHFKSSMDFDQRTPSFPAEMTKDISASKRFSSSLARMTKSFSFREGSGRFQLGSIYGTSKSSPAEPEICIGSETSKHSRTSQLKKLLNPLLKNRGANQKKEHLHDLKIEPPIGVQIHENDRREISTIKALLHLTAKSELPLFKFVVETRNEILASTVKSLSTFGKNDSKWLYTFYSVQQVTKKSGGWKNHKAKPRGFSYNVIGQMKVSDSLVPSWCEKKSEEQYMVKESVLCSVDLNSANSEFMSSRELAAVVVKMPIALGKCDHSFSDCVPNDKVSSFDDGMLGNIVAILPGGIHSLPPNGAEPSWLINRWQTGGLCDCGGWDVGCKLRILTNKHEDDKTLVNSSAPLTHVRCHLFEQGEANQRGPLFSLIPFHDGLFSVEYDAKISSLQAFSLCVALMNSHASLYEMNEVELKQDLDRAKISMVRPGKGREKHTPHPPPSPVGRV